MANAKEPPENLAKSAERAIESAQGATQDYFSWLQATMSAPPWSNTELNKKLLSYATQNVSAAFDFVQKLSQAKDLQDVVKIQTEFMSTQLNSFNEHAKNSGEIYAKASESIFLAASAAFKMAEAATKMRSAMSI